MEKWEKYLPDTFTYLEPIMHGLYDCQESCLNMQLTTPKYILAWKGQANRAADKYFLISPCNIFLFLHANTCCGYSLLLLTKALLISTHNICLHGETRNIYVDTCLIYSFASSTVNVLKFQTLYSLLFWPKFCFLCTCFLKYLVEWQTVLTLIRLLL